MGLKFLERDERVAYIADALEQYKRAGIGVGLDLYKKGKRPAVIVVDLQEAFTAPDSPLGTKGVSEEIAKLTNGAVESTAVLLKAVRRKRIPIVYVTIQFNTDGSDVGTWGERSPSLVEFCKSGTKWVEVDNRIAPEPGDYRITKKVFSSFLGTPLLQILTYNRVDTCIVTGTSISGCVRQTVIDAVSHGFYAVIPEECVCDRNMGAYRASLFDIMTKTADVVPLEGVLKWVDTLG